MTKRTIISIKHQGENHWISSTDLMAGLMMTFMLIAIAYMINASSERDTMEEVAKSVSSDRDQLYEIAKEWATTKRLIYEALLNEFETDLPLWHAEIKPNSLIVRFKEPEVLFSKGETILTKRFENILRNFFERYLKVLSSFPKSISEIRIEGHTSSEWNEYTSNDKAYFLNMEFIT
ncbi:MAG: hypothetical protein KKE44_04545 [Proteobacteria bacterium]|nr:hypothetical protein [Pseudomonadota bacterium]MBU1582000.1 hypothetical protein [Pseudomonadota bacterium]MBU2628386.1 hypothetical protein [Pseudomonadota bacterium]